MAVVEATARPRISTANAVGSRGDLATALAWLAVALAARAPLLARIEGVIDDDQSVVGLMALDIADGRRWPIFFDGQRYMGALEAYTAAAFVRAFGHAPAVVAMAPTLYFGLFAAGQYLLWRRWTDRATGHLAALLTVVSAPLLTIWGVAPRGGYSELLAWAVPTLAIYREAIRPDRPTWSKAGQLGWGFLFAFGYFLNPLSLIIYATLALDWTFGRHGADLRRGRSLGGGWVDSPWAVGVWALSAIVAVALLAAGCHVAIGETGPVRFVFAMGFARSPWDKPLGAAIVSGTLLAIAWWTGLARRLLRLLPSHPAFALGALLAFAPSLIYQVRILLGLAPRDPSLPIWIRAPWRIGPNLRDGWHALRPLLGCDARAAADSLIGAPPFRLGPPAWPMPARALTLLSPIPVLLAAALIVTVARRDARGWRAFWALRGRGPTRPTMLALLVLTVAAGLYLLQATSPDASSIRYLLPAWVALPGLLATGLRAWPRPARLSALGLLLGLWGASHAALWADMGRPSRLRPLVRELERRRVGAVVAPTPLALPVVNLAVGRVGAVDFRPIWPRLRDRYADRRPVVAVVDLEHPSGPDGDFGGWLRELARRHPGRVRRAWGIGPFEAWEFDLPAGLVAGEGLSGREGSGMVGIHPGDEEGRDKTTGGGRPADDAGLRR